MPSASASPPLSTAHAALIPPLFAAHDGATMRSHRGDDTMGDDALRGVAAAAAATAEAAAAAAADAVAVAEAHVARQWRAAVDLAEQRRNTWQGDEDLPHRLLLIQHM